MTTIPATWHSLFSLCAKAQESLLHVLLDLKYDLERSTKHTIIRSVSGRLKSSQSVHAKLQRFNLEDSPQSAYENLHDIAGIRLICSYLEDLDRVRDALLAHRGLEVLEVKDYVRRPKASGYRSIHVIVRICVQDFPVQCEIQLRTAAMDSWAALEHQLRYKATPGMSGKISAELTECADLLYEADCRMQKIHTELKADAARQSGLFADSRQTAMQLPSEKDAVK